MRYATHRKHEDNYSVSSELGESSSTFLDEGLEEALETGFLAFVSFFSAALPFFGFSGESFHRTPTWMDDVRTRKSPEQSTNAYSGHRLLGTPIWVGFPPDRKLRLDKEVVRAGLLLRLLFGI